MGKSDILLNHQISAEIISLIESTKEYCFLVTPYYKPWPLLNRTLEKAALLEKKIVFIFRYGEMKEQLIDHIRKFNFDIHLVEKLHTKLYLNERTAILTSMNLYDASKEQNYEVGYIFSSSYDARKFRTEVIENDILAIKPKLSIPGRYASYQQSKVEEQLAKERQQKEEEEKRERIKVEKFKKIKEHLNDSGYCIRCNTDIRLNPSRPYCDRCYKTWSSFGNVDYIERFCHSCGRDYQSSLSVPLCNDCFSYYRKSTKY